MKTLIPETHWPLVIEIERELDFLLSNLNLQQDEIELVDSERERLEEENWKLKKQVGKLEERNGSMKDEVRMIRRERDELKNM